MSMEATQWAWGQSVRSTYKLVLLALADREYRKQQGGWNASSLKGFFLSDPYQRESFWLCWEGAHRPNMARGF